MAACVLDVEISPKQGPGGIPVRLTVRASDPASIFAVRASVVGYGFEETLGRSGPVWSADTAVPWEATPGEYLLDIYAVDASGQRLTSVRTSFTVTE